MRTTDERMAAVHRREAEIKRQLLRRGRIIGMSSAAACLLLIVGIGFAMPGIMAGLPHGEYGAVNDAASIFYGGGALGYVLIGALAFVLGICVTVLCYRLRLRGKEEREETEDSDGRAD